MKSNSRSRASSAYVPSETAHGRRQYTTGTSSICGITSSPLAKLGVGWFFRGKTQRKETDDDSHNPEGVAFFPLRFRIHREFFRPDFPALPDPATYLCTIPDKRMSRATSSKYLSCFPVFKFHQVARMAVSPNVA